MGRFEESVEREMAKRHYKREKVRGKHWIKKGNGLARALGPALILDGI